MNYSDYQLSAAIDTNKNPASPVISTHVVRAACPHDCPDTCAMLVTVETNEEGTQQQQQRVLGVRGNREHPTTRGALCTKVANYEQRTHNSERVKTPLRRVGEKGAGKFEAISWTQAIDAIAKRFGELANSPEGAETILPYSYAGTLGLVQSQSMDRRFFHRLGASLLDRTICATAGMFGYRATVGASIGTDPERFADARLIVLWGTNTITSNVHLWSQILDARKKGARIICIDPRRTRTADQCDEHIAILPGTDAAFALALMHVIFAEDLADEDYLASYCIGAEDLRAHVKTFTPTWAAEICGVAAETIERFAREYAATRPAVIRINYGMQRHAGGGMAVRTVACLPAVTGAWRESAGGILLSTSGTFPLNYTALERTDLLPAKRPRTLNMSMLGDVLTETNDPPVRALYVYGSNPAAVAPEQSKVIKGLMRDDLFTVVHEIFMTDTCDYADIVLPATTQLEQFDLHKAYGHLYMVLNEQAIAPLHEAKCNTDVFRLLAARMGFNDDCFKDTDETIARQALASTHANLQGITLESLREKGWQRLNVAEDFAPFAKGNFPTPSGKCELRADSLAAQGLPVLPQFTPPRESVKSNARLAAKFPLALISPATHAFCNSTFGNLSKQLKQESAPYLEINPHDAQKRNITDGESVKVYNERGACRLKAVVTDRARKGVVVAPSVWWNKLSPGGTNINQLSSQALTDLGGGATFYDALVEVERI